MEKIKTARVRVCFLSLKNGRRKKLNEIASEISTTIWKIIENQRIPQTCWGDFRFNLGLPGPRGGRRWTRLVPQFDFLQLSSKSGLWEAISWPIFVFEKCRIQITKTFFAKTPKDLLVGCWGYIWRSQKLGFR